MKNYLYKVLIASLAIILVYNFTIGKEIKDINKKINYFSNSEGRKKLINSIKKEMKKANEKENYLDDEERILIKNFIKKIKEELNYN
tara:strand:- start:306 stop:566 length:261 start_codon:yes stop_codon:yes gene_type:complete